MGKEKITLDIMTRFYLQKINRASLSESLRFLEREE
jgi:hypothetical protein